MRMHLMVMITVTICFGFCGCAATLGGSGLRSGKFTHLRFPGTRKRQQYWSQLSSFAPQECIQSVEEANAVVNYDVIA